MQDDKPAAQWQPIETAPRDGTLIIALETHCRDGVYAHAVRYEPETGLWTSREGAWPENYFDYWAPITVDYEPEKKQGSMTHAAYLATLPEREREILHSVMCVCAALYGDGTETYKPISPESANKVIFLLHRIAWGDSYEKALEQL